MSLCIRSISNKLTPFVGTRKPITHLDRQLPKHVKESSAFLQEFLAAGVTVNRGGVPEPAVLYKPGLESLANSKNIVTWNYKLKRGSIYVGRSKKEATKELNRFSNGVRTEAMESTVFSVGASRSAQLEEKQEQPADNEHGRPSQEQLDHVFKTLEKDLPTFFVQPVDYRIYHPMIVFENNIKGTIKTGLAQYITDMSMLRIIGHIKFAYVKFDVMKITLNPEDDSIKVRWRIRGMSAYKIFFTFWKFKLWNLQPMLDSLESWYDGFSTFYVDGNGKVYRHVADRMMPDQDVEVTEKDKTGVTPKLALFLGLLVPREFLTDMLPLWAQSIRLKRDKHC